MTSEEFYEELEARLKYRSLPIASPIQTALYAHLDPKHYDYGKELLEPVTWLIEHFPRERGTFTASLSTFTDKGLWDRIQQHLSHKFYSFTAEIIVVALQQALAQLAAPFSFPENTRFSHTWIVAPPDAGKTTLLENLIVDDLPKVAKGHASVFVLDSQNEMIPRIAKLKAFAPGGPLEGRLVLLEIDPDYPLALNLFDVGGAAPITMISYVLESLLQVGTTAKQGAMFRYLIEAMTSIPEATIRDFKRLLGPSGYEHYKKHIDTIDDEDVQEFFRDRFDDKSFKETKTELLWRLDAATSNKLFRQMFSHPQNKLDLFTELNSGKVVLVNANAQLLQTGREAFGRFFLCLLMRTAEQRMMLPKGERLPVFAYVDEASDYIKNEQLVAELIDKARKQRIALTLAHQRMTQIESANVKDALSSCAIIMAGRNKTDARALAPIMRCEPELIQDRPQGSFATYVTGFDTNAFVVSVPPSPLTGAQWMSHEEERELKRQMRERYSYQPNIKAAIPDPTPFPKDPPGDYQQWDAE